MDIPNQAGIGAILIVVGVLLFLPGVSGPADAVTLATLFAGSALLTAGTYLFGTSEGGRPV
ncbi:hypothetical protein EGH24_07485 [Halonotius terrestris]|uniref:Uncharacterized protein n=2 Tax=Halonotius terrestris TaxID=2487750 RepID=A0A8J8TBV5_9EURY|nr:hypothetical protein EGH24_07485 [Halonotius terrestris]